MNCLNCGKEFESRRYQKYCCKACRLEAYTANKKRAEIEALHFALEWSAWKRDFARGKTTSNPGVSA